MFAVEMSRVIAEVRTLSRLDEIARDLWSAFGADALTEEQAQALSEAIEARKREVRGQDRVAVRAPTAALERALDGRNSIFPPKCRPKSPDRQRSIARRRRLAASGPMPPQIAAKFTTGQLAVMRIIADEVESRRGTCELTIGEIASRAGVCIALARNAIRIAERLFLISTQFRKREGRPHLPSVIRIVSQAWNAWLIIGGKVRRHAINAEREDGTLPFRAQTAGSKSSRKIGSRKMGPTGTDLSRSASSISGRPQTEAAQRPSGRPTAVA